MNPEDIRKLAETYRPNLESLADKLAQGPLVEFFSTPRSSKRAFLDEFNGQFDRAMKLADEAIARMMRK
jgi:hypothetical protein